MSDHDSDLLGITEDAYILADLISGRFVEPPLSVGIFGREGSGKSFFAFTVSKRINQNSEHAKLARQNHQNTVHCSNIVQVHYNAWQNAGTNPWVSLTEAIFTEIDVWAQKSSFDIAQFFSIGTARKLMQNYELEVKKKKALVERARKSLADAESHFQNAIEEHAENISSNKWSAVSKKLGDAWENNKERDQAGQVLGINHISKKPEQHAKVLEDSKSLGGRAGLITNSLLTRKYIGNFLLILVFLVVLSLASYYANGLRITSKTTKDWLELLNSTLTIITSLVAIISIALSLFLRNQAAGAIDRLYEDEQILGDAIREVDQTRVIRTTLTQQKVAVWQKEFENRETRLAEAEANYVLAQQDIDDFSSGNILKNISDYYRSQILSTVEEFQPGFIPVIREDFSDLSSIMANLENPANLDHEQENLPVERIVILIDDLDQCQPQTTMAILQAAHLLLSFQLFVVVFILDPLKLLGTLRPHYLSLAEGEGSDFDDNSMIRNEIDYLSKLIQFPFWVRPIKHQAIDQFMKSTIQPEPGSIPAQMPTNIEMDFMIQIATVIDLSPRELKRFINGYKYILIVRFRNSMTGMAEPDILAVLTQLAIVIAMPSVAPYYFKVLDDATNCQYSFYRFLEELASNNKIKQSGNYPRIRAILDKPSHFGDNVQTVQELQRWSREVKLLSYNVPPTL